MIKKIYKSIPKDSTFIEMDNGELIVFYNRQLSSLQGCYLPKLEDIQILPIPVEEKDFSLDKVHYTFAEENLTVKGDGYDLMVLGKEDHYVHLSFEEFKTLLSARIE